MIGEAADAGRATAADRQIENLLGDFGHPVEHRPAAGQHHARLQALLEPGPPDLVPHDVKDLLGARLKNLGQDAARHHARLPAADAGHLDRLVLVDHRDSAQPHFRLIFSASGTGVRRPTAMSLVK